MLSLLNARVLVILWLVGFLWAGLGLSVLQEKTAASSCWGHNAGWQNEIAIWNLGAFLMLIGVLKSRKNIEPYVLPGLFVLSLGFLINHVVALFEHQGIYITNLSAALVNGGGVLLLLVYYLFTIYRKRTS